MNRPTASALAFCAATAVLAGCSLFRWSGYADRAPERIGDWSAADLVVSTTPGKTRPAPLPVPGALENVANTLYYSDLGPDFVDVSEYPAQQKYNYALFSRECSRCHTLARAINSPTQSRAYWRFHLARMNLHARVNRQKPLAAEELKYVLDFLEYDSHLRKNRDRRRFEEQTEELKRRFDPALEKILEQAK